MMEYFNLWLAKAGAFFTFDPSRPLVFTDIIFWVFLSLVLLIDGFVHRRRRLRHAFLFVASTFFYYKTTGPVIHMRVGFCNRQKNISHPTAGTKKMVAGS
jgi:hypothetical protein